MRNLFVARPRREADDMHVQFSWLFCFKRKCWNDMIVGFDQAWRESAD
jgi:hypothetical protein